mgnify:CR=1 FL=1
MVVKPKTPKKPPSYIIELVLYILVNLRTNPRFVDTLTREDIKLSAWAGDTLHPEIDEWVLACTIAKCKTCVEHDEDLKHFEGSVMDISQNINRIMDEKDDLEFKLMDDRMEKNIAELFLRKRGDIDAPTPAGTDKLSLVTMAAH